MAKDATPAMLNELFVFHGAVERVAIKGEVRTARAHAICTFLRMGEGVHSASRARAFVWQVGFVEFASASSTASALLFDRTKLAGNTVSVAVVEEELPDEVWDTELEGEELFEQVDHADTTSAPASPDAAVDRAATELPPPAVLPAPNSTLRAPKVQAPSKAPSADAGVATKAKASASAAHKPASASAAVAASPLSAAAASSRSASLAQLASEPMNSAKALLGVTLGLQLLALLLYA